MSRYTSDCIVTGCMLAEKAGTVSQYTELCHNTLQCIVTREARGKAWAVSRHG